MLKLSPMKITNLGMMANDSPRAIDLALESVAYLKDKVRVILVEDHLLRNLLARNKELRTSCKALDPEADEVDMVLVFGGDGTILRAASYFGSLEVPICGVNMGRMGFLSQVEPKDLPNSLKRLVEGDYEVCKRMKLDVYLGAEKLGSALNELLVQGDRMGKMLRGRLRYGSLGDLMFEGDGIVVSTPTGSTGHSLSAGGPVVDFQLDAIIVAPLGALTPARPIVIPADKDVGIFPGSECALAIDGEVVAKASQGAEIRVARSNSKALFAVLDSELFWKKLRQRIGG